MRYENPKTWFHVFENEESVWGFSFSSSRDGDIFHQEVITCNSNSHLVTSVSLEEAKLSEAKPPERITAIGPIKELTSNETVEIKEPTKDPKETLSKKDKKWTIRRNKRESKTFSSKTLTKTLAENNPPSINTPPPSLNVFSPPPPLTTPNDLPPPPPLGN